MKKLMSLALFALALGFTSCGSDDDLPANCRECNILSIDVTICDNGDGTITTTGAGQSETTDIPDGVTFDEYVDTLCSGTITIGL